MFNGVIHTDYTFGDMLSDQAGGIVGTLGVLPSASLSGVPDGRRCNGIHEPVHGSAPDMSGSDRANKMWRLMLKSSRNADQSTALLLIGSICWYLSTGV